MMTLVINILVTTACLASALFVLRYFRVKWRNSPEGRITMSLFGSLLLVFVLAAVGTWTSNNYPGRTAARFVAYSGTNVLLWYAYYLLVTDQRRGRRGKGDTDGSTVAHGQDARDAQG